ncbi:MAG: sensor histidine kinase [Vicinamibacterales bacterium]
MSPERWLQWAGVATWGAAVVQGLRAASSGDLSGLALTAWTVAAGAFLLAFLRFCRAARASSRGVLLGLLGVQTCAALAMTVTGRFGVTAATLLVVVAGQLPSVLEPPPAAAWIGAQTVALAIALARVIGPVGALTYGAGFGGFQLFALGAAALAQRERRARETADAVNVELTTTRVLMAEHSRVAERLRIARDLHDTLGHHLTALSLQLDVASRLVEGRGAEHVREAHAVTKLLLADVRDVVSQLRDGAALDLAPALRALARPGGHSLTVHVHIPDAIVLSDDAQANAVLRCAQEIVTNALRHSRARNLWLGVSVAPDGVTVSGRDDGRGAAVVTWGNGLKGMRERVEALRGTLEVVTREGEGFEVRAFIPHTEKLP